MYDMVCIYIKLYIYGKDVDQIVNYGLPLGMEFCII